MTDLLELSTDEKNESGVTLVLRHPSTGEKLTDDKGNKMSILLCGVDSKEYQSYQAKLANQVRANKKELTFAELKENEIKLLASLTRGFENLQHEGEPIEYSFANTVMLYKNYRWIKEQVDEFVKDVSNFLASSPTS